jgi:hypothetical protein
VTSTVLVLLGLVGVTIIVTRGDIFAWLRRFWPKLLSCPLCVGFWVGVGYDIFMRPTFTSVAVVDHVIWGGLVGLLALMTSAWLIEKLGPPTEGH